MLEYYEFHCIDRHGEDKYRSVYERCKQVFERERNAVQIETPAIILVNRDYIKDISTRAIRDVESGEYDSAITKCRIILSYVPARWLKDKEIILDILSNGTVQTDKFSILKMLSKKLVDDEEVVAAACVANSGMELKFASDRLQYSIEFVLNLLMSYDIDLNDCLHEEIARDEEVAIYLKKWDVRKRFNV